MLTVLELNELLDRSHFLSSRRDFVALIALLDPLPRSAILEEPELGHYLALALSQTENQEGADRLLNELDAACTYRGNDRLFRRRLNLQAVSFIRKGKLDEAEALLRDVQLASDIDGDAKFLATATMNLGVVADMRCIWDEALAHYHYALVLFQKLGDQASTAGCYHNLGMLHRQRGNISEAEIALERALDNYQSRGTVEERIATEVERALIILQQGDPERAEAIAQVALAKSQAIGNPRLTAESLRSLGIVCRHQHAYAEAREHFIKALQLGKIGNNQILTGELYEELSILSLLSGTREESATYLADACRIYELLGSTARATRAVLRQRDIAAALV